MSNKQYLGRVKIVLIMIMLGICSCSPGSPSEMIIDLQSPISFGEVQISLIDASIRNSMQTHYLMSYPKDGFVFFRITLSIEGASDDPDQSLLWGDENLRLFLDERVYPVAQSQRIISTQDVEYKAAEKVDFHYVYFFEIPKNSPYTEYQLQLPDEQTIPVGHVVEIPKPVVEDLIELHATVSGGSANIAGAYHTTIGGGQMNIAGASHATVGGGRENNANNFYATIGGGYANTATARDTVVGGGSRNIAEDPYATVGGGIRNVASAPNTTIAGGAYNQATDDFAVIAGGTRNTASGFNSVIGGGAGNTTSNDQATISGGLGNQASGAYATVGGGHGNSAEGAYASIPGGMLNQAHGDFSFASGQRAIIDEDHDGAFLFADASEFDFHSASENELAARATGGIRFISGIDNVGEPISGVVLPAGSGAWSTLSDRNLKANITPINQHQILAALTEMDITRWNYLGQDASTQHIGPMAQDFYAAFGLGEDATRISTVDADGIALASIQGLYDIVREQEKTIISQQEQISTLETRISSMEQTNTKGQWVFCLIALLVLTVAFLRLQPFHIY